MEDRSYGKVRWDLVSFHLYTSPNFVRGEIEGVDLQKELVGELVANEECLQYLRSHPERLENIWREAPADTKGMKRWLIFFGTVFLERKEGCNWASAWRLQEGEEKPEPKVIHNLFFQKHLLYEYALLFKPTWLGLLIQPFLWARLLWKWPASR